MKHSSETDVLAEVSIMHRLAGHILFPYCYGFIRPNIIICQLLGSLNEVSKLTVYTLDKIKNDHNAQNELYFVKLSHQLVEGIKFMHDLSILHNDIKGNNVIVYGEGLQLIKIIDFGKSTHFSRPEVYNLTDEQKEKYNTHHQYLAYELRNLKMQKQSVLTDVYSVGYILKKLGLGISDLLTFLGENMSVDDPKNRLSLVTALRHLKSFISKKDE
jgi:serine/threonine protein kinase